MIETTVEGAVDVSAAQVRARSSVFGKLVAIMAMMAVTLLLIVSGFFALFVSPAVSTSIEKLVQEYARTVAADPLDVETAKQMAARSGVHIRYEGPDGSWTTSNRVPSVAQVSDAQRPPRRHLLALGDTLLPAPNGGSYVFHWNFIGQTHDAHVALYALLPFVIVAIILIAHAVLKRQLRPLRELADGVARLGEGQLDIVLLNRTRDEFGALTDAFNRMVERVRTMVRARDQLLLDVSHELRSPLTRLKVALALMPSNATSNIAADNRASMAADLAEMETMIAELLELERLRDGRGITTTPQELELLLSEAVDRYQDRPPGVRLLAAPSDVVLPLDADRVRIVLRNVLENALKYSRPDSRPVEVAAARTDGAVVVRISDDGPGIPAGDLANIFEPFFRVDRSRSKKTGGYGLGLSICKRIMEAHGGTITAENNASGGATFVLTFPG